MVVWTQSPSKRYLTEWYPIVQNENGKARDWQNSVPPEGPGNVFESIHPCRHVLQINKLRVQNVVFANAARAVRSKRVSRQAAVNDTFPTQTGHIRDAGECRAVFANRRVGSKGIYAATTFAHNRFVSWKTTSIIKQSRATYSFQDHERR